MLPAAENDSRPARPVCYQTHAGASVYAIRAAERASASLSATGMIGVDDCYQPKEGGCAFRVSAAMIDWEVTKIEGAEYARLVQAGLRRVIEAHLLRASACVVLANAAKPGSCFERNHLAAAKRERDSARELERQLTVSVAPAVVVSPACCTYGGTKGKTKSDPCWACTDEASNRGVPQDQRRD